MDDAVWNGVVSREKIDFGGVEGWQWEVCSARWMVNRRSRTWKKIHQHRKGIWSNAVENSFISESKRPTVISIRIYKVSAFPLFSLCHHNLQYISTSKNTSLAHNIYICPRDSSPILNQHEVPISPLGPGLQRRLLHCCSGNLLPGLRCLRPEMYRRLCRWRN